MLRYLFMSKIFTNKKKGIILIIAVFIFGFIALVTIPKAISGVISYKDKRARSTVEVNLSPEEQAKIQKEIQDLSASSTADPAPQGEPLAKIYRDIASRHTGLGRLGESVKYYDKALQANKTDTNALVEKGKILGRIGQLLEGEGSIKKAIEFEPTQAAHYSALAQYYRDLGGDNEHARGTYIEGLIRTNNDTNLMREFASFLESIGELSEAYLYWVELAKKFPTDAILKEHIKALESQAKSPSNN